MRMSFLEIAANIVLVAAVFLAARNHWSTWPLGVLGCILFAFLFFEAKLYADVTLQIFFIITNLAGWRIWMNPANGKSERPVTQANPFMIFVVLFPLALLTAFGYGTFLLRTTDAHFPIIDSMVLTLSVIAQFLLMGRKLETWIFWVLVDLIAVPLYAAKGLYLTSAVYAAFLINAVYGYINWRNEMKMQEANSDA